MLRGQASVNDLSFTVRPGRVTGFLGPNGAGKSTTMRMILGLDRPTAGSVTVNGKPFAGLYSAMREVGALLDAKAVHGGRAAYRHLALAHGIALHYLAPARVSLEEAFMELTADSIEYQAKTKG